MNEAQPAAWVQVATLGPLGFFPVAPGTIGSLAGAIAAVGLAALAHSVAATDAACLAAGLAVFAVGVPAASRAEVFYRKTDPGQVIIDEVAGQLLTLAGMQTVNAKNLLAGFLLFRILDVIKPFPARRAEHLPGGWGIMMDDVIAGIFGAVGLVLLRNLLR